MALMQAVSGKTLAKVTRESRADFERTDVEAGLYAEGVIRPTGLAAGWDTRFCGVWGIKPDELQLSCRTEEGGEAGHDQEGKDGEEVYLP